MHKYYPDRSFIRIFFHFNRKKTNKYVCTRQLLCYYIRNRLKKGIENGGIALLHLNPRKRSVFRRDSVC